MPLTLTRSASGYTAVSSLTKAVQHLLGAARRDAEDGALGVLAAGKCRPVERALYFNQVCAGVIAVGSLTAGIYSEVVKNFLGAARRHAEDRAIAIPPPPPRRAIGHAFLVNQACLGMAAVVSVVKVVQHVLGAARRNAEDRAVAFRAAVLRRAVEPAGYVDQVCG